MTAGTGSTTRPVVEVAEVRPLRCSILRGGTSRGVFFFEEDLPADQASRDRVLLRVFGSPDVRQIDGLGGASSQTSKAAIIGPASIDGADVDYTFAQVSITASVVDWGGTCGNLSSAVGPFSIDHALVPVVEPTTTVRIHCTNTGKVIHARVPVNAGRASTRGGFELPGVPGTSARIELEFIDPAGSSTGSLLPTGRPVDRVRLGDGRSIEVSVIDASNPVVFVAASDVGLTGTELPTEIEERRDATALLEEVRSEVAVWLGLAPDASSATSHSPGLPKVGVVAPPARYATSTGRRITTGEMDLHGRLMSMQTAHRSYMATGAVCTAAAALVHGSVVHRQLPGDPGAGPTTIRIAHPYGVMAVDVAYRLTPGQPVIHSATIGRTARHILDGQIYVPVGLAEG